MLTSSLLRCSRSFLAVALCGAAFAFTPTEAQAFLGVGGRNEKAVLLASALDSVSRQTGRQIIVLNAKGAVVSSTLAKGRPSGKGHIYVNNLRTGTLYPEIKQTLSDGKTRDFSAKGPDGKSFKKTITALKDQDNHVIGAVVVVMPLKS